MREMSSEWRVQRICVSGKLTTSVPILDQQQIVTVLGKARVKKYHSPSMMSLITICQKRSKNRKISLKT